MTIVIQHSKINNLQVLRAIAVLLVAIHHIYLAELKYGSGDLFIPHALGLLGASGVDLFFIVSGFVMVMVTRAKFQRANEIVRFISSRLTRVYPLYWFYSLILLVVFLWRPEWVNATQGHQVNLLESFLLLPQNINPLLMVGWSLVYELYFYGVFALLMFLPEDRFAVGLIVWGILTLVANVSVTQWNALENSWTFLISRPFVFNFLAGCLIARMIFRGSCRGGAGALSIGALWLGLVAVIYFGVFRQPVPEGWTRAALFGIPYALLTYGASAIEIQSNKLILAGWIPIGDASYSIYLSHVFIITGLGRVWSGIGYAGVLDNLIVVMIMLTGVILFGFASYRYVEMPLLTWMRRLMNISKTTNASP